VQLKYKLNPKLYYNLVCFNKVNDYSYKNVCFKYYFSGTTKTITIDSTLQDTNFAECRIEGGH
jgi:hypothetical protein